MEKIKYAQLDANINLNKLNKSKSTNNFKFPFGNDALSNFSIKSSLK
jgi:hypothetical protein